MSNSNTATLEVVYKRRPGISKLVQLIQSRHPDWSPKKCVVEAKLLYTNKHAEIHRRGGADK